MNLTTAEGHTVHLTDAEKADIWRQAVELAAQHLLDVADAYAAVN